MDKEVCLTTERFEHCESVEPLIIMKCIKLVLNSNLQYYAKSNHTSIGNHFYTENHPTKSAVIGMVGAALGIPRNDSKLDFLYENLDVKYHCEKPGSKIIDFQTVRPSKGEHFVTVEGKKDTSDAAIIKYVEFLQDSLFYVYIGGEETLLKEIHTAFCNPKYPTFLGRRRCIPIGRIISKEYEPINMEELKDVYDCV